MNILLVALNASYMHTNIAVRSLKAFAEKELSESEKQNIKINWVEFTINQPVVEILRGIENYKADLVLFSTYIWNAQFTCQIIPDVKKILPHCKIGAGGPEFSYSSEKYFKLLPSLDFIMHGEGEKTFIEIVKGKNFSDIKGISYRTKNETSEEKIIFTGHRELIQNLDELSFTYPEIPNGTADPDHKIYYYESSRGCPFSCSYCLSSVDKNVRYKSLEKVKEELKIFLDAKIGLVKFVDRTYNLKPERYIEIWRYILNHHNGKTMFHFEIEAEHLSEEAIDFLQTVPSGIMQFEMGVQSANKKTLTAINRSTNVEKLAENILRIPSTIHQHLDLIAGLPYEDMESFGKSYDFVMALKPDALQLGFLKILSGTQMEAFAKNNGWLWMENPVYETFSTPYMSFSDIMFLKDLETITDVFWNKHIFDYSTRYIFSKISPWNFIKELTEFARENNSFLQARKDAYWFELYSNFLNQKFTKQGTHSQIFDSQLLTDLLRYDFILTGKKGNFPGWYKHCYNKENHMKLLNEKGLLHNNRLAFATTEYEEFTFDIKKLSQNPDLILTGNNEQKFQYLIEY